jgi:SMODS-associating 4TM effector domain
MAASTTQNINQLQNTSHSIDLLKAADVAHQKAQRAEVARAAAVSGLALLAIVSTFVPRIADTIAIVGVASAVGTEFVWPWISRRSTRTAMLLQEMLDVELFDLPWNGQIGDRITGAQIQRLKAAFSRDERTKRDWYVDVSELSRADAVMMCQRENLLWDSELRLAWAGWVAAAATLWVLVGVAVALIGDWTTRELFVRWLAPSLPGLLFAGVNAHGHWTLATFHTISPSNGKRAEVKKDTCGKPDGATNDKCKVETIRSHADAVVDNNLDYLAVCS